MARKLSSPAAPFRSDFKDPEAFTALVGEAASFRGVIQSGTNQIKASRPNSGTASQGSFPTKDTETGEGAHPIPAGMKKMNGGVPPVFKKGA